MTQPPDTVCLRALHFCAIHVKELLAPRTRSLIRVANSLFRDSDDMAEVFKRAKINEGSTWLLDDLMSDETVLLTNASGSASGSDSVAP